MSSMSLYRFESALTGLRDCYRNMPDSVNDLIDSERVAYKKLIALCKTIAEEYPEVKK